MTFPDPAIARWFERRTYGPAPGASVVALLKREQGLKVSVCLPARNEEDTIGRICSTVVNELMERGMVDELVVVDSGSTDSTRRVAAGAGAIVVAADELPPDLGHGEGKGEALWKSLSVLTGDVVVWLDSDTRNFSAGFVTNLVFPLLDDSELQFVKGFYERPLHLGADAGGGEGARVTEVAVRPLLSLLYPHLAGFVQPLSGEYAGRRRALLEVPFFTGYGVDIGLLVDMAGRFGLDALAQADLGLRVHRNRDLQALGRTSFQVLQTLLMRAEDTGILKLREDLPASLVQFPSGGAGDPVTHELAVVERPPMRTHLRG